MDIVGDSGLNGLFEHIVQGVLNDYRWRVEKSSHYGDDTVALTLSYRPTDDTTRFINVRLENQ